MQERFEVVLVVAAGSLWLLDRMARDFLFPSRKPVDESAYVGDVPKLSSTELYRAFSENEVAADGRYKGKVIEVSGKIESLGRDIGNSAYISLEAEGAWPSGVQCFFLKDRESSVVLCSKGQRITIRGKCDGKFGNVRLMQSRLQ